MPPEHFKIWNVRDTISAFRVNLREKMVFDRTHWTPLDPPQHDDYLKAEKCVKSHWLVLPLQIQKATSCWWLLISWVKPVLWDVWRQPRYLEPPLSQNISRYPWEFNIAGFYCIQGFCSYRNYLCSLQRATEIQNREGEREKSRGGGGAQTKHMYRDTVSGTMGRYYFWDMGRGVASSVLGTRFWAMRYWEKCLDFGKVLIAVYHSLGVGIIIKRMPSCKWGLNHCFP